MGRDGQPVPALLTDRSRWQALIFGDCRALLMRRADGQRGGFWLVQRGAEPGAFLFERPGSSAPPTPVAIRLPEAGVMQLETRLDGAALKVSLRRVDETKFPLLSRGFHWITEVPFNR